MRRTTWLTYTMGFALAAAASVQTPTPVITLPAATVKSADKLGFVVGLRLGPGGIVLVNDAARRQLKLFDSTLTHVTVVQDSLDGSANSYGPVRSRLIPYLGDSSLKLDNNSQTMLVLDARGRTVRAIAPPQAVNFGMVYAMLTAGPTAVDARGRMVFRGMSSADSVAIVRADLETRRADTLGMIKVPTRGSQKFEQTPAGGTRVVVTIDPMPAIDAWAMLADGSVALIRGHDYHIDWIRADGTRSSSPKMPFDWKRLTDADKQKVVDSARAANNASLAALGGPAAPSGSAKDGGSASAAAAAGGGRAGGAGAGAGAGAGDPAPRGGPMQVVTEFLPLKDIGDYYPPIGQNAVMADLDNNLWILPTTSAQSTNGELVYDVINAKGELFERVRVPAGRSIVGFGRDGVVYLVAGDRTNGFYLERSALSKNSRNRN